MKKNILMVTTAHTGLMNLVYEALLEQGHYVVLVSISPSQPAQVRRPNQMLQSVTINQTGACITRWIDNQFRQQGVLDCLINLAGDNGSLTTSRLWCNAMIDLKRHPSAATCLLLLNQPKPACTANISHSLQRGLANFWAKQFCNTGVYSAYIDLTSQQDHGQHLLLTQMLVQCLDQPRVNGKKLSLDALPNYTNTQYHCSQDPQHAICS